jgi:hypothetical protein
LTRVALESTLTCPECGHAKTETMPTDACLWSYECERCHIVLKPKPGDCCVYCSYGTVSCPPSQEQQLLLRQRRPVQRLVLSISSAALRLRLQTAEAELERLTSAPKPASIESLLPRLRELIRAHVRNIAQLAEREPVRARAAVQQALEADAITIRPAEAGRNVIAEYGLVPVQLATVRRPSFASLARIASPPSSSASARSTRAVAPQLVSGWAKESHPRFARPWPARFSRD